MVHRQLSRWQRRLPDLHQVLVVGEQQHLAFFCEAGQGLEL